MAKRKVMLKYPELLIKEPVLFRMAKEFDVMPNIRRARPSRTMWKTRNLGTIAEKPAMQNSAGATPMIRNIAATY